MNVTIRSARPEDFEAITRIYAHAVLEGTASYEIDPPSREEMIHRFRGILESRMPYLVAEIDGRVVGYAYFAPFRPRPAYRFMVEDSIYVDPAFHARGIGRLLLGRLIGEAERIGIRQMVAVIGDARGNTASIRLHEALGFHPCGTIEGSGFKHGRWLDTLIMQLPLNGGTRTLPEAGS